MKNVLYTLIIGLFLFSACDKMEEPYIRIPEVIQVTDTFPSLDRASVYRKILIEEYTGHRCAYCPLGHAKLDELAHFFGDTLVAICIHAGDLAIPRGSYTYDFRTKEGVELHADFGISTLPAAVVNRTKFGGNKWALSKEQWQNAIQNVARNVYAGIQIITKKSDNILDISTKTTMIAAYGSPLRLSVFLMEDNIIQSQLNDDVRDEQYQHNHVLRASCNGTYGAPLSPDGILLKDSAYLSGYRLDFKGKDWKIENTSVVVILHDPATKEVLQVEVMKQ